MTINFRYNLIVGPKASQNKFQIYGGFELLCICFDKVILDRT